jgi:hypothetical protein
VRRPVPQKEPEFPLEEVDARKFRGVIWDFYWVEA